jgi:ATP-dependent Lon protease
MKSIQKELGQAEDEDEIEDLQASIKKAKMPKAAKEKAESELKKLSRILALLWVTRVCTARCSKIRSFTLFKP